MSITQKKSNRSAKDTGEKGLTLVRDQLEKRGAFVRREEGQANLLPPFLVIASKNTPFEQEPKDQQVPTGRCIQPME